MVACTCDPPSADCTQPHDRHDGSYRLKETRRAFPTTVFFVMLAVIAAALASAYMRNRGLAKAGSRDAVSEDRD